VSSKLADGRQYCKSGNWADGYDLLSKADSLTPLDGPDLELLATAAYLIGREARYCDILQRAHRNYLEKGQTSRAARSAFWLGLCLLFRGEIGSGTGWLATARGIVDTLGSESAEDGYLLLPSIEQLLSDGENEKALAAASDAVRIGTRFGEKDLIACALHLRGRALIGKRQVEDGLAHLDQAMIAVLAGDISPIMTGLIYCSVIEACLNVYALARAWEWTNALKHWCDSQPQLVAFSDTCLVHRSEILQLHGAWEDSVTEAERASARDYTGTDINSTAEAFYRQGEVCRLRGDFELAEGAFREASRLGYEPQPGFALLRLAQGQEKAALASIHNAVAASHGQLRRAKLLPAYIEILLTNSDVEGARNAAEELEGIAKSFDTIALDAIASRARGEVAYAEGDPRSAIGSLRRAFEGWQKLGAPYEAARVRVLLRNAYQSLGDADNARLEYEAAKSAFQALGATSDLLRIEEAAQPAAHSLTKREIQILRHVAAGKTNKAIASDLFISEKTVDRHVSNIFKKLGVSSRTAAAAYVYQNDLI
jgi:DNA-binding CsgD family transcriptional regulator